MDDAEMEQAARYLETDPLLHMNMLESLRHGMGKLLQAGEGGVLLFDTASEAYMMSARDGQTAERMIESVGRPDLLVAHQAFYIPEIEKKVSFSQRLVCRQAVYQAGVPLPSAIPGPAQIRQLDERFLGFVAAHYSRAEDEGYLRRQLRAGVMYGAFVDGEPAGFIGMHAEGSIGMLEVLPQYRRRGIAAQLETFQVNRLVAAGFIPFSQIVEGNEASFALHRKLGFSVSDKKLCWLFR